MNPASPPGSAARPTTPVGLPSLDFASVPSRRGTSPVGGATAFGAASGGTVPSGTAQHTHVALRLEDGVPVLTIPDAGSFEDVREALRDRMPELIEPLGGRAARLDLGHRELQLFDLRRILHVLREEFKVDVTGLYVQPTAIHRYAERELKLKLFVPKPPPETPAPPRTSAPDAAPEPVKATEVTADASEPAPTRVDDADDAPTTPDGALPGLDELLAALSQPPPDALLPADALLSTPTAPAQGTDAPADAEPAEALRRPIPLPDLPPDPREGPEIDAQGGKRVLTLTRTLRSGAAIRYDGDVVIYGDVNAGAQIRAGGNVTVLGKLRGVVHAGAATGAGSDEAWILAFDLAPTQLRIGRHIAIAPDRGSRGEDALLPEIATVFDGAIVIEPWKGRMRR
jgi:septum site-determining protein MinC